MYKLAYLRSHMSEFGDGRMVDERRLGGHHGALLLLCEFRLFGHDVLLVCGLGSQCWIVRAPMVHGGIHHPATETM